LQLSNSRLEGEALLCQANRELLVRAVKLGFREVLFFGSQAPALCVDENRQYVWALLVPGTELPIEPTAIRVASLRIPPKRTSRSRTARKLSP
jgi:hypothetical protein